MRNINRTFFLIFILITLPLSGCTSSEGDGYVMQGETLVESQNPCQESTESMTQSMTSILVNGEERLFRLSVPSSDAGAKLPVIIAFHGGDMADEDFNQQSQFDQLGELEKFIMVYAIAEEGRTAAEGEWFLNTAATSQDDNDFSESIVDELSKAPGQQSPADANSGKWATATELGRHTSLWISETRTYVFDWCSTRLSSGQSFRMRSARRLNVLLKRSSSSLSLRSTSSGGSLRMSAGIGGGGPSWARARPPR